MNKTHQQPTGFTLFAFTWAMAGLIHQLSFTDWRWYDVKGVILTATILWVLFKPSSWQRFVIFLIVDWVAVAWTFPVHPNHIVFSWVVNGTLLASLLIVVRKDRSDGNLAVQWYDAFAPWLRVELCLLYFFTVFHKLNVAYFDLDWSCAAKMHLEIGDRIPLLPEAPWAQYCAIYGTLIIETAIPLLLLFGRTRLMGLTLGLLFHGLLALHSHIGLFSFSSVMMALYVVFLPSNMAVVFRPPKFFRESWPWALSLFVAVFILWITRRLLPAGLRLDETLADKWKVGFLVYYGYLGVSLFMLAWSIKIVWGQIQGAMDGRWKAYPLLIAFPLLILINASGPYLGLKTQTSCSMFSNLHTENGLSNHLIVPAGIQITNWQYDLVEIIDSNDPALNSSRESDLLVVYLDLRRIRTTAVSNFWVTFRRNGSNETFDMTRPETYDALPPFGFLAQRYFYFRPVERDPMIVRCKH